MPGRVAIFIHPFNKYLLSTYQAPDTVGLQENGYFCITFFCGYQEECERTGSSAYNPAMTPHVSENSLKSLQWPTRRYEMWAPLSMPLPFTSLTSSPVVLTLAPSTRVTGLCYSSNAPSMLSLYWVFHPPRKSSPDLNSLSLLPSRVCSNEAYLLYAIEHDNPSDPIICYPPYLTLIVFLFPCSIWTRYAISLSIIFIVISPPPTVNSTW